jgi:hypothetical protein
VRNWITVSVRVAVCNNLSKRHFGEMTNCNHSSIKIIPSKNVGTKVGVKLSDAVFSFCFFSKLVTRTQKIGNGTMNDKLIIASIESEKEILVHHRWSQDCVQGANS